jgi:hypothetical protein
MSLAGCQINPIDVNFYLQKGQMVESALPYAN